MESDLRKVLQKVCFGYKWEEENENSYSVTLECELKIGYITPKAKAKKLEKIKNKVKKVLDENGYQIKSIEGFEETCKALSIYYFSIYDGKERKLDKDVGSYSFMGGSNSQWIYEFQVTIEIAQPNKTDVTESLEKDTSKSEKINDFIEDLYDLRKDSIAKDGEYGLGNLVFKEFRNLGYLDNLKELKNEYKSKELSLEETFSKEKVMKMDECGATAAFGKLLGPEGLNLIDHTFILDKYGIFDTYERASFSEMIEGDCEEYDDLTPFYENFDVDAGFVGAAVLEYPQYFDLYYFKWVNYPYADPYFVLCPHNYSIKNIYEDINGMYDDPDDELKTIDELTKSLYRVYTNGDIYKNSIYREGK